MSWGWALYLSVSDLALELFFNPSLLTQCSYLTKKLIVSPLSY